MSKLSPEDHNFGLQLLLVDLELVGPTLESMGFFSGLDQLLLQLLLGHNILHELFSILFIDLICFLRPLSGWRPLLSWSVTRLGPYCSVPYH